MILEQATPLHKAHDYYPDCPEALIVTLARSGERAAFEELVRRQQSSIRNLMRRCCNDINLADDLSQQVFIKVWINIRGLRDVNAFPGWLKKLAISIWLQYLRKNDALRNADEIEDTDLSERQSTSIAMDLGEALATLPEIVRLCIVLSYQEGMSHSEITEATGLALGTVKSHIKRGTGKLKQLLSAYREEFTQEKAP